MPPSDGSPRAGFAGLLARLRAVRGMSQEDLAEASGISVEAISLLERNPTRRPRVRTARALADALGLTPEEQQAWDGATRPVSASGHGPSQGTARGTARGTSRGGLPAPVSSIVGREEEIAELSRLVRSPAHPLVTVTGPGGVGKSRLALEVAWRVSGSFERVHVLDTSTLRDLDELAVALATAVGCTPGSPSGLAAVTARIGRDRRLIVLDGAEHVVDVAAGVSELLGRCPRLGLLVTSRVRLGLAEEVRWALMPLPLPEAPRSPRSGPGRGGSARGGLTLDTIVTAPAVALLVERARAVRPGFSVTAQNAGAVAALCRRLDGLPLAIELAAVQLGDHTPAELEAQLRARVTTLAAQAVDVPGRHRTLRATVEWSTERLGAPERAVLTTLGAFRGSPSPRTLATVLADAHVLPDARALPDADSGVSPCDVVVARLDTVVARLAAASLVTVSDDPSGQPRIGMLDTIREVARDQLVASGNERAVRSAHARTLLGLVRATDVSRQDLPSPDQLTHVDADLDDVRAALRWVTGGGISYRPESLPAAPGAPTGDASGEGPPAELLDAGVAVGLGHYYVVRGLFAESHRVLAAFAQATRDPAAEGIACYWAGIGALEHGHARDALVFAERAARACPDLGRSDGRCALLTLTAAAWRALGDPASASRYHQECLRVAEEVGSDRYLTIALNNLGALAFDTGDYEVAARNYARSLRINEELDDSRGITIALLNLGEVNEATGRFAEAREPLTRAVEGCRSLGEPHLLATTLAFLAQVEVGLGNTVEAVAAATEAIAIARDIEYPRIRAQAEIPLGDLALAAGDTEGAERHYRAALDHTSRTYDMARMLERLAASCVGRDPGQARQVLAEADELRREHGYQVAPADRALLDSLRRRLEGETPVG